MEIENLTEESQKYEKDIMLFPTQIKSYSKETKRELYREQQMLKNKIEYLEKEINNYSFKDDDLYNEIEANSANFISVHPILNNL